MDMEQARFNMVEQQIRPWDVLDQTVLDALLKIKREDFAPEAWRVLALADLEIPLGFGESMLSPKMEARIVQEARIRDGEHILEIGTGSGYMTALLAHVAGSGSVHSVDIVPEFTTGAKEKLARHGISNVTLQTGDAARGWSNLVNYDVVVVTGSLPVLPEAFTKNMKIGGRLLAVVGECPVMEVRRITRLTKDVWHTDDVLETCIPALKNVQQVEHFVF
ncbi:MAG: protein-L-isoaspartate O-methyltransferase [Sulfuricellaceae bacterium]